MRTIELTQGEVAVVDDADYPAVSAFKWHAVKSRNTFYAARNVSCPDGTRRYQFLHQFLMPHRVKTVDHKDGDGRNNQRSNLRWATRMENGRGLRHKTLGVTSKFRGVSWESRDEKWRAQIRIKGRLKYLGPFIDELAAARAYDVAARRYFGEFAAPNFPS